MRNLPQLQEKRDPSGSVRDNRCDRFRDDRLGDNIDPRFCRRQDGLDRVASVHPIDVLNYLLPRFSCS